MSYDWNKHKGKWTPASKGDVIEGKITRITEAKFSTGPVPEIHIRTSGGVDRWVVAGQTVLISRLAESEPQEGDWIRIEYLGEADKSLPGFSPAKLFDVIVKRDGGPPTKSATEESAEEPF